MKVDIKVPEVGESVQEALLAEWYKEDGETVEKDEPIFVLETDKVTLEVPAEQGGVLQILVQGGETVEVGKVVGRIDTEAAAAGKAAETQAEEPAEKLAEKPVEKADEKTEEEPGGEPAEASDAEPAQVTEAEAEKTKAVTGKPPGEAAAKPMEDESDTRRTPVMPPSVRRLISEKGVDVSNLRGTGPGGMITKGDVILYLESGAAEKTSQKAPETGDAAETQKAETLEAVTRKPMSPIRKRIASHLLDARQNTAMLTTFNEIDMSRVKMLRERLKDDFFKTYDVRLGFMSFFIKAVVAALKEFPEVNARIEGDDIVYHHYYHIGIAIGAEKGLVVPVIRHADQLGFAGIEGAIVDFAKRVRENAVTLSELSGGTFSITNGGIYGSLLSTPILNMPQSGILGMHKIEDRPVAIDGEVVIRPMMYVALSYDHRIVDGKDAVTFLRRIKEFIETPERIMMEI